MKNRRGITLFAIVIAISIIIVLSTVAIFEYKNVVIKAKKLELAKDFYTMTKLVKDYEFMHSEYPIEKNRECKVDVNSLPDKIEKNQFSDEPGYKDNNMIFKYIDHNKLNTEDLVRGKPNVIGIQQDGINDRYIFSEWTKRIYYLPGVKIGNTTYYTLTDELYKLLNISEVK